MNARTSALVALALFVPVAARADDWLAALPECAGERVPSSAQLLYPRAGLPAVVAAGDTLVVRARLSLPLTPPPGVQQPRALEGFEAELAGHAHVLSGRRVEQTTRVEVVNVRPEGPSSLRYRLALPVPAWMAPGTYDLRLRAKGASLHADSSVRVLAPGAAPRLGAAAERERLEPRAALHAPIDVWVEASADSISRDASLQDAIAGDASLQEALASAAPELRTAGLVAALRVGGRLWVIGGCDALHLPFEVEVASALRAEARERVADVKRTGLNPTPTAEPSTVGAGLNPTPTAEPSAVGAGLKPALFTPIPDGWQLHAARAPLELSVLIPAAPGAPGLRADRGELRFYPAGEVAAAPHALIARWSLPALAAGERARLSRVASTPLNAQLRIEPDPVRGDAPVRVSARADRPLASLALRFDHRHTAHGLHPVEHRYRALGEHRIHGLAIAADGTAAGVRGDATVVTARMSGGPDCAARAVAPGSHPVWGGSGLWLGVLLLQRRLLKRRRGRLAGNRLGAEPRSARSLSFGKKLV